MMVHERSRLWFAKQGVNETRVHEISRTIENYRMAPVVRRVPALTTDERQQKSTGMTE